MSDHPFPHERLDAWHVARQARVLAYRFTRSLPPGWADEAKQINKASGSVVRNICEGANRYKPLEKVQKFEIAQGEAGEAAGAVQSLLDIDVGDTAVAAEHLQTIARVAAMLTGLIRRLRPG